MKPGEIYDREREWAALDHTWQSTGTALVMVLGRRRAGKSFLLARFAREVGGIYYQATRRTEAEQLDRLSAVIGAHFGDAALEHGVSFPDWESLFGYVRARAKSTPLLLVLDEFPYLADAAPALPSIVQSYWDHEWQDTSLKLVLSGSHISAMRRLEAADQPLYGRRTSRLDIRPFDYRDAAAFVPWYDARDLLLAYGIFGGLPGHLTLLDPAASLGENVMQQLLVQGGRLVDEAQHLLDGFLADAQVHYSVIDAIARGEHTWSGITSRVGRDGGSLSRTMGWLIEMGLVERQVPITEAKPLSSKRALYRVSDPYLAFWYRFISPMISAGMIGMAPPEVLWEDRLRPRLNDYMGGVFESVCRAFTARGVSLPFRPLRVGAWWDREGRNEIDVVALGGRDEVLVGECKWGRFDAGDLAQLRQRVPLLLRELGSAGSVTLAAFVAGDVADDVAREAEEGRILLFTPEDLYA